MSVPFVAGSFKSVPVRVHAYTSRGVFMLVDESNSGCWTDPHGRVLLPSLDLVDRVLAAHGYERRDMVVVPLAVVPPKRCATCSAVLDDPADPVGSRDCGGDCLRCMAEAGDPDCLNAALAGNVLRHDGTAFAAEEPKEPAQDSAPAVESQPAPAPAPAPAKPATKAKTKRGR